MVVVSRGEKRGKTKYESEDRSCEMAMGKEISKVGKGK